METFVVEPDSLGTNDKKTESTDKKKPFQRTKSVDDLTENDENKVRWKVFFQVDLP
jgi:hypothetical protein